MIQPAKAVELALKLHQYFQEHEGYFHLQGPFEDGYQVTACIHNSSDQDTMDFMNFLELDEETIIGSHRSALGMLKTKFRWGGGDIELQDIPLAGWKDD